MYHVVFYYEQDTMKAIYSLNDAMEITKEEIEERVKKLQEAGITEANAFDALYLEKAEAALEALDLKDNGAIGG
jgi:DNA-binding Lrp family transcriptional regulator